VYIATFRLFQLSLLKLTNSFYQRFPTTAWVSPASRTNRWPPSIPK